MPAECAPEAWSPRRIAIIGAGAMGTSLAAALGTVVPVVLVCRNPDRAAAIFRNGARAEGRLDAASRPFIVRSAADLLSIGGVSAVFITTKTTSIPEVAAELRDLMPSLGDQPGAPFLVSYQNGIEPGRQLMTMVGDPRVLRMVLNIGATLRPGTGAVHVSMASPPHAIGCLAPAYRPVCERLASLLTRAGLETNFEENIEARVWFKGIMNAAVNPIAALVNATVAQVLESPAAGIVGRLLDEGLAVASAEGVVGLGPDARERMMKVIARAGPHTPSMVEDIRAGRESEVGQLNRQIIDRGRAAGVPTPTHDIIDALIETFDWKVYAGSHRDAPATGVQRAGAPPAPSRGEPPAAPVRAP